MQVEQLCLELMHATLKTKCHGWNRRKKGEWQFRNSNFCILWLIETIVLSILALVGLT